MQIISLDDYTAFTDLYSVIGLSSTTQLVLTHRGTSSFILYESVTAPAATQIGYPVKAGDTIFVPGYKDKTVWFKGGNGKLVVQKLSESMAPLTAIEFPADSYSSANAGFRRIKVEEGSAGFYEGRIFRTFKEFTIPQGQSYIVKAYVPLNAILSDIILNVDASSIRISAHLGGTESPTTNENLPLIAKNRMGEALQPPYNSQSMIKGGLGILMGGTLLDVDRVVAGNQTVNRSTVDMRPSDANGIATGTYYFVLENIGGSAATGVFKFTLEERV